MEKKKKVILRLELEAEVPANWVTLQTLQEFVEWLKLQQPGEYKHGFTVRSHHVGIPKKRSI